MNRVDGSSHVLMFLTLSLGVLLNEESGSREWTCRGGEGS